MGTYSLDLRKKKNLATRLKLDDRRTHDYSVLDLSGRWRRAEGASALDDRRTHDYSVRVQ